MLNTVIYYTIIIYYTKSKIIIFKFEAHFFMYVKQCTSEICADLSGSTCSALPHAFDLDSLFQFLTGNKMQQNVIR